MIFYVVIDVWFKLPCFSLCVTHFLSLHTVQHIQDIPQLIIQVGYVISVDDSKNISLLVGFSLILTILGLFFSFSVTAVVFLRLFIQHNKHVCEVTEIGSKLTFHCPSLSLKHGHTHLILTNSITHALRTCKQSNLWIDRSDVQLSIQVFYIANRIKFNKEIDIYFDTELTNYQNNNNNNQNSNNISKILLNAIKDLGHHGSDIQKSLIHSFQTQMKLKGRFRISNVNILYQRTTNNQDEFVLVGLNSDSQFHQRYSNHTGDKTSKISNLNMTAPDINSQAITSVSSTNDNDNNNNIDNDNHDGDDNEYDEDVQVLMNSWLELSKQNIEQVSTPNGDIDNSNRMIRESLKEGHNRDLENDGTTGVILRESIVSQDSVDDVENDGDHQTTTGASFDD